MMKSEFEELAGYEVNWKDYIQIIEPMYLALPNRITKQEFVKMIDKKRFALKPLNKIEKEMKEIASHIKKTCIHYIDTDAQKKMEDLAEEYTKRLGCEGYNIYTKTIYSCYYPYKLVIYTKNYYTVREIELA